MQYKEFVVELKAQIDLFIHGFLLHGFPKVAFLNIVDPSTQLP